MPYALFLGVSEERFWDSCPSEIKPYEKSYQMRLKQTDEQAWIQGMYFYNALSVSLSHFCGKKTAKYTDHAFLSKAFKDENEEIQNLTEEKKEDYVNQLFMNLMIMQANFNNSHKK